MIKVISIFEIAAPKYLFDQWNHVIYSYIRDEGLHGVITVCRKRDETYRLLHGVHSLMAFRSMGLTQVEVQEEFTENYPPTEEIL